MGRLWRVQRAFRRVTRPVADTAPARTGRGVARRFRPHGLVLMYHRVADLAVDPHRLAVSPGRFAEHLDVLAATCHPMPLAELAAAAAAGNLPRRAVAVTLDDGYVDSYTHAWPALRDHAVPATMFIVTDHVGGGGEYWWDELAGLLLETVDLPERLEIEVAGAVRAWTTATPAARLAAHRDLHRLLLTAAPQEPVVAAVADWAGSGRFRRPANRVMTWEEIEAIAAEGLVVLGAHSRTHAHLGVLPPGAQEDEIAGSKQRLEERLGRPVGEFSYPYGGLHADTPGIVRRSGLELAVTVLPQSVWRETDPLLMGRHHVDDWDGTEFRRRLDRFFADP